MAQLDSAPNRTSATAIRPRKRTLSTRAGDIEIALPKLRQGSLLALIAKQGFDSSEFVRSAVRHAYQELIDAGLAENIGATRS